jgi:hypothetical protein
MTSVAVSRASELLDREAELAAIDQMLGSAETGAGRALVIEGPAGIGKTSLLDAACVHAAAREVRVMRARGTELERDYPPGVVRQALEPVLRYASDREPLLHGAAKLAAPALLDAPEVAPAALAGLMHGVFWLVANLAGQRPVLMRRRRAVGGRDLAAVPGLSRSAR